MSDLNWLTARPVAHRGLHNGKDVIENTQTAFERALSGNYAMECDVQLTGNGEVVVFHDYTLDRLTESTGKLIEMTTAEIKKARFKQSADTIQTLPELLAQIAGKQTLVVELKSQWNGSPALADATVEALAGYGGPVALMSFDPYLIGHLADAHPDITRGLVADQAKNDHYWGHLSQKERLSLRYFLHLRQSRPQFIAYGIKDLPQTPPLFCKGRLGMPLLSWTVRTQELLDKARGYVDQVIFEDVDPDND